MALASRSSPGLAWPSGHPWHCQSPDAGPDPAEPLGSAGAGPGLHITSQQMYLRAVVVAKTARREAKTPGLGAECGEASPVPSPPHFRSLEGPALVRLLCSLRGSQPPLCLWVCQGQRVGCRADWGPFALAQQRFSDAGSTFLNALAEVVAKGQTRPQ